MLLRVKKESRGWQGVPPAPTARRASFPLRACLEKDCSAAMPAPKQTRPTNNNTHEEIERHTHAAHTVHGGKGNIQIPEGARSRSREGRQRGGPATGVRDTVIRPGPSTRRLSRGQKSPPPDPGSRANRSR